MANDYSQRAGDPGLATGDPFPGDLSLLSLETRTPNVVNFPGEDGGKTTHYILRWVTIGGEKGS